MINVRKIWENSNIQSLYPSLYAKTLFNEPLKNHTSFKIGGPAEIWVEPTSKDELLYLINWAQERTIPVSIFGGGTNLVVSDLGIKGIVVSLAGLKSIELFNSNEIFVKTGAGVLVNELSIWCKDQALSGFESFAGLPGTVGGAVYMNARCYETSISDVFLQSESLYLENGRYKHILNKYRKEQWGYKHSPFQQNRIKNSLVLLEGSYIVLSVDLKLQRGKKEEIEKKMDLHIKDRTKKGHFSHPSGGSAFKNNRKYGKPTGAIIDELGLKGMQVGDAQIAPWHGNFVINRGNACAQDVFNLIKKIKNIVKDKTGFIIEPELVFVGEEFNTF